MTAVSYATQPAQSETRQAPKRGAHDLDLIEHIDVTLEVLHGKWKVHLIFLMARESTATAGCWKACRASPRRS